MKPKLLLTRPTHEIVTRYLSAWAQKIIDLAHAKAIDVFDLTGQRASASQFSGMTAKLNPSLIMLNGHGSADVVYGHDDEPLVGGALGVQALAGAVTYAVSCKSALVLGPQAVQAGALAYIGYADDFIFENSVLHAHRPIDDPVAALYLEPSNQVMVSLLKGHTPQEAHRAGRAAFRRNILAALSSKSAAPTSFTVSFLLADYQNLAMHMQAQ